MNSLLHFNFSVDKENKQIKVERNFSAPKDLVWAAWTDPDILDLWWAPKPYKNVTISMDLRPNGIWHYYMESPEGEKHYCLFEYMALDPGESYSGSDAFCDEHAVLNNEMPRAHWKNQFSDMGKETRVDILITYPSLGDLETVIKMGFKEGFAMGLSNLDEYLKNQSSAS